MRRDNEPKLLLAFLMMSEVVEDRPAQRAGAEHGGMLRANIGILLQKREDARSLLGAVNLGERLVIAAKALEDTGAQPASAEGIGVVGAEVGALLLWREDARTLVGAVDFGERLIVAAKVSKTLARSPRVKRVSRSGLCSSKREDAR